MKIAIALALLLLATQLNTANGASADYTDNGVSWTGTCASVSFLSILPPISLSYQH